MSKVIIPPIVTKIDDCDVYILELSKYNWIDGKTHYIVSCKIRCGKRESQVFPLDVTSNEELEAKLKTEVAKMKLISLVLP